MTARTQFRAWSVSLLALAAASAGMAALATGTTVTSAGRMSFAAAVLSSYCSFAGLLVTRRDDRTRRRCLIWGGLVPFLVGLGTAAYVIGPAGPGAAVLAGLPWLAGPVLCVTLGPAVPELRRPRWLRRNDLPARDAS